MSDQPAGDRSKRPEPDSKSPTPELPKEAQDIISHRLRETYRQKLNTPIPDRFERLLEELKKRG